MKGYDVKKDYYQILGVAVTATTEKIKQNYRAKVLEHHPDRGGDAEKCKEINEAYEALRDKATRGAYDSDRDAYMKRPDAYYNDAPRAYNSASSKSYAKNGETGHSYGKKELSVTTFWVKDLT